MERRFRLDLTRVSAENRVALLQRLRWQPTPPARATAATPAAAISATFRPFDRAFSALLSPLSSSPSSFLSLLSSDSSGPTFNRSRRRRSRAFRGQRYQTIPCVSWRNRHERMWNACMSECSWLKRPRKARGCSRNLRHNLRVSGFEGFRGSGGRTVKRK